MPSSSRHYSRFIPGEELGNVRRWEFGDVHDAGTLRPLMSPTPVLEPEPETELHAGITIDAAEQQALLQQAHDEGHARGLAEGQEQARLAAQQQLDDYVAGQGREALQDLTPLAAAHPGNLWLQVALAEAEARAGQLAQADKRFESLLARMPTHRALALSYARTLAERNTRDAGTRAVAVLRPLLATATSDPLFQQAYARANEIAGDDVRAGEAWAEAAFLGGRPEQALVQLNNLKKRATLDYYARSRIEARIAAITPTVLELRRQGIRDPDVQKR